MAFSYWATAMSLRISPSSRLARRRPPSKMGRDTVGTKAQARLPPSNRPSSSALAVPQRAVSAMRGKKAARAAPIWARAARSWCSAAAMSGRAVSSSEGRPGRSSASTRASSAVRRRAAGRVGADQLGQGVQLLRACQLQLGQQGLRLGQQGLDLGQLQARAGAHGRGA